jgi:uncharacterized protein (TIGR00730 family)
MTGSAICVFCGSRFGGSPGYRDLAERVGHRLAQRRIGLVYGGGALGLMGVVSDSVLEAGGHVTGVIPEFLRHAERQHDRLSRLIVTGDMFERKQTMFDLSDGFLALPGGLGTLDEILEVLTWRQLCRIDKPLVLLSEDDFWSSFTGALSQAIRQDFAGESIRDLYRVESSIESAFAALGLHD